jgi:hypothetical protein
VGNDQSFASGEAKDEDKTFSKAMSVFAGFGFFGLIALLPFMILPFMWGESLIVAVGWKSVDVDKYVCKKS